MELGKVVGTVVASQKSERLQGCKLLVVGILDSKHTPTGAHLVATDAVGAGAGETVLVVRGSSARQAKNMETIPTDACIVGIVDALEMHGRDVYRKGRDE